MRKAEIRTIEGGRRMLTITVREEIPEGTEPAEVISRLLKSGEIGFRTFEIMVAGLDTPPPNPQDPWVLRKETSPSDPASYQLDEQCAQAVSDSLTQLFGGDLRKGKYDWSHEQGQ